mgnify:CR=1 FL=1
MKELTLREKEDDFLKLNIGEESYLIPLASSMTLDEIRAMDDKEKAFECFLEAYRNLKDKNDLIRLIKLRNYKDVLESCATCINEKYCDKDNHYSLTYTFKKKDC